MKKAPILIAGIILFCTGLCTVWAIKTASSNIKDSAVNALHGLGFEYVGVDRFDVTMNTLTLHDIALDTEDFSKIGKITLTYSLLPALLRRQAKTITIQNISLIGDLDQNGRLNIAGWKPPRDHAQNFLNLVNAADSLTLQAFTFDILTEPLGGLRFHIELDIKHETDGAITTARLKTNQHSLSLDAQINAAISAETGNWELQSFVEQGRIKSKTIDLTRLYGELIATGTAWSPDYAAMQFTAGQMTLHGFPAQTISGTAEYRNAGLKIITEGKSPTSGPAEDNTPLEFSLLYADSIPDHLQLSIYTPATRDLIDYLGIAIGDARLYDAWLHLYPLHDYTVIFALPLDIRTSGTLTLPMLLKKPGADLTEKAQATLVFAPEKNNARLQNVKIIK